MWLAILRAKKCAVLDPVLDLDLKLGQIRTDSANRLLKYIHDEGLQMVRILETHCHADHLTAAHYLRSKTGGPHWHR